ncbi:hypothetical protein [Pseudomonas sp.]|uniref:hypothetical protein n=1 Tax=Pseudomonas sp. TaxID=306 RepID=UPI002637BF25|nr:hypothetical protein [Pseudomonas sp.]
MNEKIFVLSSHMRRILNGSGLKVVVMMMAMMCSALSQADTTNRNIIVCRTSEFVKDLINANSNNDEKMTDYLLSRNLCQGFKSGLQYEVVSIAEDGILSIDFLVPTTSTVLRMYSTRELMGSK